jgi:hypothetical protein
MVGAEGTVKFRQMLRKFKDQQVKEMDATRVDQTNFVITVQKYL